MRLGSAAFPRQDHAWPPSREDHINCEHGGDLKTATGCHFHNAFMFSMNGEIGHTGFVPMVQLSAGALLHEARLLPGNVAPDIWRRWRKLILQFAVGLHLKPTIVVNFL